MKVWVVVWKDEDDECFVSGVSVFKSEASAERWANEQRERYDYEYPEFVEVFEEELEE